MRNWGTSGKLTVVGIVARLSPRFWDGRRLLQFLTGLAMAVLALGAAVFTPASASDFAPAASVAAAPPAYDTEADGAQAPAPAAPAVVAPALVVPELVVGASELGASELGASELAAKITAVGVTAALTGAGPVVVTAADGVLRPAPPVAPLPRGAALRTGTDRAPPPAA